MSEDHSEDISLDWMFNHPTEVEFHALSMRVDPDKIWDAIFENCSKLFDWVTRQRTIEDPSLCALVQSFGDRTPWVTASSKKCWRAYISYIFLFHFYGNGIPDDPPIGGDFKRMPKFGKGKERSLNYSRKDGFDFYCETFFVHLFSASDSFCQTLNDLLDLGLKETEVGLNTKQFKEALKETLSSSFKEKFDQIVEDRKGVSDFRHRIVHRKPLDFVEGLRFRKMAPSTASLNVDTTSFITSKEIVEHVVRSVEFLNDWASLVVSTILSSEA